MGVGGHGVPVAAGREMRDAHDELTTARALEMDVFADGALVAGFQAAEFHGRGVFLADQRDGINGVGGITEEIEDGGRRFVFRGEGDLLIAATDVEHVEIVELVALAFDGDDAGAADVERAQLAALGEVLGAEFRIR